MRVSFQPVFISGLERALYLAIISDGAYSNIMHCSLKRVAYVVAAAGFLFRNMCGLSAMFGLSRIIS